jgi:hypothetical protein
MADETASKPEPQRFATPRAFEAWLRKNHASSDGAWLRIAKADARPEARRFFARRLGTNPNLPKRHRNNR